MAEAATKGSRCPKGETNAYAIAMATSLMRQVYTYIRKVNNELGAFMAH
jgi:hypothetical protein